MGRAGAAALTLVAVALAAAGGCGTGDDDQAGGAGTTPFPAGGVVEYQIGGPDEPGAGTDIVIRDREAAPADGRYSICYVNAFQTQPGDATWWVAEHPDVVLRDDGGEPLIDPDWPGEIVLDTSSRARREEIVAVVGPWIDRCAADGFDAVELDNLDSWTRAGVDGRLTEDDNVAMARALVERATAAGLAAAQKNTVELGARGRDEVGFSFAIAEECAVHDECDAYREVYGDAVIDIEYTDDGRAAFEAACAEHGDRISVLLRDRDVTPAGHPAHVSEHC